MRSSSAVLFLCLVVVACGRGAHQEKAGRLNAPRDARITLEDDVFANTSTVDADLQAAADRPFGLPTPWPNPNIHQDMVGKYLGDDHIRFLELKADGTYYWHRHTGGGEDGFWHRAAGEVLLSYSRPNHDGHWHVDVNRPVLHFRIDGAVLIDQRKGRTTQYRRP